LLSDGKGRKGVHEFRPKRVLQIETSLKKKKSRGDSAGYQTKRHFKLRILRGKRRQNRVLAIIYDVFFAGEVGDNRPQNAPH